MKNENSTEDIKNDIEASETLLDSKNYYPFSTKIPVKLKEAIKIVAVRKSVEVQHVVTFALMLYLQLYSEVENMDNNGGV